MSFVRGEKSHDAMVLCMHRLNRIKKKGFQRCVRQMFDVVQAIPTLHDIHFPVYQQDIQIMNEINAVLDARKK